MPKYWPIGTMVGNCGFHLESRAEIALHLLERWGLVAGLRAEEDNAGRAAYDVMPATAVVDRAFELADLFMARAESRGDVRPYGEADAEATFRRGGELERVKSQAEYPRERHREILERIQAEAKDAGLGAAPSDK